MKEKNQVVPDEVLSKEFLSQFKTETDVNKFLKQLHTQVLKRCLKAIRTVFLQSSTQICVVHQIRNSCKSVVYKDKKEFTADMKNIYNTPNKEVAAAELDNLERKWGGKYPYAILSWRNNWDNLIVFFHFPLEIRKIIYTTNIIENLNGKSESTQNQSFHSLRMMQSKRPFIFHLWKLRRNRHNRFITKA